MTAQASTPAPGDLAEHRSFLNRYYGASRWVYDLTRKYYLFGRDQALDQLLEEPWETLIEVGPGTGRNLRRLHKQRPDAAYGGLEPCDEMRVHASARAPWIAMVNAFAEEADFAAVLGRPPDRILFSYCLSMVGDPQASLTRAIEGLAPGGQVVVVDFGTMDGLPARESFRRFLATFHVHPVDLSRLGLAPASVTEGPLGYFHIARFTRTGSAAAPR